MKNTYPEPYKSKPKNSLIDPSTCYNRQCTSYCSWKICEATGKWLKRTGDMNAKHWVLRLAENGYKTRVNTPTNNGKCVGVSTGGKYGHVVWADNSLFISEYNYLSNGLYHERTVGANSFVWIQIKSSGSFLPARGHWQKGDKDARIGKLCSFYADNFYGYFCKNKEDAHKLLDGNYFGNNCERWTKEFQKRTGLQADGKVGPITYEKLKTYGFGG